MNTVTSTTRHHVCRSVILDGCGPQLLYPISGAVIALKE